MATFPVAVLEPTTSPADHTRSSENKPTSSEWAKMTRAILTRTGRSSAEAELAQPALHALDAANGQLGEYLALGLVDQGAGAVALTRK